MTRRPSVHRCRAPQDGTGCRPSSRSLPIGFEPHPAHRGSTHRSQRRPRRSRSEPAARVGRVERRRSRNTRRPGRRSRGASGTRASDCRRCRGPMQQITELRVGVVLVLRLRHDDRGLEKETPVGILGDQEPFTGAAGKNHPATAVSLDKEGHTSDSRRCAHTTQLPKMGPSTLLVHGRPRPHCSAVAGRSTAVWRGPSPAVVPSPPKGEVCSSG